MNVPKFNAEVTLGQGITAYRGKAAYGGSRGNGVLPMLPAQCTGCEIVGGFGRIRGVGRRSCCQDQWICDPRCHMSTTCWFESCTPDIVGNTWLSF